MKTYRAITHASEVLTGEGISAKDGRHPEEADLGRIRDGALVYSLKRVGSRSIPAKVEWVGPSADLPKRFHKIPKQSLKGQYAIIPGMVDCHTHLIFAGDRSTEFAARCGGATYQEIAAQGGGIASTVRATREASAAELEKLAILRLKEIQSYGVKTVEIKSGYGLSTEAELKVLRIIPRLRKRFPELTLTATFLGAHAFPTGCSREVYVRELVEVMLPQVVKQKLADSCDIFIDEGYFTVQEGRALLEKAKALGLKVKVHADELVNTESAAFAAEVGALSADHLLKISDAGIQALARSNTVAVLLPGTAFYLKARHAPARKLVDAGARVAISTDFNPGTCMCLSLPAVMTAAALYLGLTRAELFAAVTYNAARALGLQKRKGSLEKGKDADFSILPFERFEELYYRFAWAPR
ncbi:MAG: imidazolonepropionase [Bdellovibrionales bacterium GWA1_52_35]|nr:MAG: imidazolonepropionase [Bdellovibrionales bacterium GWA1_52_35]HCM40817.1 imidazolonepropionase [Bdellovibrionales bacterium]